MDANIRDDVLKRIKPDPKEHKKRLDIVNTLLEELKKCSKDLEYDVDFFIGGSFGKNTYLKTSSDVDIFARFLIKYKDKDLSIMLEQILQKSKFQYKLQKGSRDYFSLEFKEKGFILKVELVPNRRINRITQLINSTDASPLHVEFLKERIKKNPNLCDEIRLTKQFFKAKGLYGAESYINGFSGHVIDILIAYYGSLEKLLIAAKKWGDKTFIDVNKFFKSENDALKEIDSSKHSSLIVVDPIIKTRNAAKALSEENYFKFIMIAHNFDKFRESDFEIVPFDLYKTIKGAKKFAKINKLSAYFYVFNLELGEVSEDIAGSKLLRLFKKLANYFEGFDFEIFKKDFFIDIKQKICLFVYCYENTSICGLKKVVGPYVTMKDAASKFIDGKEYYFIEKDRLYAYEKRVFTTIDEVNRFSKDDFEKMIGKNLNYVKKIKLSKYN